MRNRNIIILLTSLAAIGAVASSGMAKPEPSRDRDGRVEDDSLHITMTAQKGRLGVAVVQISAELRGHFGAPADRGVLVDGVKPDSPAARAGVRVGDVIVEVDGDAATAATDILDSLSDRKKGDAVAIAVVRNGKRSELRATLEDDPGPVRWRGGRLDPKFRKFFDDALPSFDFDARKRIEELERRLDKLEQFR